MSKRIVISGYYGFGNTGDEAVLAGILETFKELQIDARVTVLSANPSRTRTEHPGVMALHRYHIGSLIAVISRADLVISGGGSLFQDVTSVRSVRYYLFVLQLAQLMRRKTMIYAQGVGPLNTQPMRDAVQKTLNKTTVISVRDKESKKLLEDIGVKNTIHLSADPSFLLQPDTEAATKLIIENGLAGKEMLGISLRPWPGAAQWLSEAAEGIEQACTELGVTPVLIPMQEAEDAPVCEAVRGGVIINCNGDPQLVKGVAAQCGLMVGMRLHSLILAAGTGVPTVSLSYDPKVTSFASVIGSGCIDIESLTSEKLANLIIATWGQRTALSLQMQSKSDELRGQALKSGNLVRDMLGQR